MENKYSLPQDGGLMLEGTPRDIIHRYEKIPTSVFEVESQAVQYVADIIVDGPFILAEKNLTLSFRGSENQRVIDMVKTRKEGKVVLYRSEYEDLF